MQTSRLAETGAEEMLLDFFKKACLNKKSRHQFSGHRYLDVAN